MDTHKHTDMNEHAATVHIATEATKCPFFSQARKGEKGGCPFDPAHPHAMDLSKVKECPAFQKDGCPFKNVHTERIKECPAFKDGKCPFDGAKSISLARISECPAFQGGKCPYASLQFHDKHEHKNMNEHTATVHIASEAAKCPFFSQARAGEKGGCPFDPAHLHSMDMSKVKDCPAFQSNEGCPFKHVHTERLKECPAFKDGKCPFADGSHPLDLSRVHECPAFKNGCPYSTFAGAHPHPTEDPNADKSTPLLQPATATPPAGDAAKCPVAHLHGKVPNPHAH